MPKQQITPLQIICSSALAPTASQQQGSVRCGLQFSIHNSKFSYFHLGVRSAPKLIQLCNMSTEEHEGVRGNWMQRAWRTLKYGARSSLSTGRRKGWSVISQLQLHRAKLLLLCSICTMLRAVQPLALNSIKIQSIFLSRLSVPSLVCDSDVHS